MKSRCNLQAPGLLLPEGQKPLTKKSANWPSLCLAKDIMQKVTRQKVTMQKVTRPLFTCHILNKAKPGCFT